MRISKAPEIRKREMIDTAMKLFASKGYEATTMTDIAKEMNVVSGLCYRYFKSKEDLYNEALELYAKECVAPMIQIMDRDYNSINEYITKQKELFRKMDGKEKYHYFFHAKGNEMFHKQLEYSMLKLLQPHIIGMFERMKQKKIIQLDDCKYTALFLMYGQMPIINDDSISTEEKIEIETKLIKKIIPF
ncbi:MAG: TetR/AcrR family transcriptional regulator [Clostridia bacterium]|jgi:AcrR family transcriptional regulator|nr:TetR/AcrR family transcriptional regulator [Clostridia bacterium]MCI1999134.1 TetR/AcrR family transcriptional regulator [Clostridia bacterium]MCI2013884.1 TetR/AcrR family transcriptional regulator [Clostridia bacterium]